MKCWEQGDIDEKVILRLLFNVRHDKGLGVGGGGTGKMTYTAIPLGGLNRESMESNFDASQFARFKTFRDSRNSRLLHLVVKGVISPSELSSN